MLFMPFQILGVWLRGLVTVAILACGIALLVGWYNLRETVVEERIAVPADSDTNERQERPDGARAASTHETVRKRTVSWEFGLNRATAFLLGGAALLLWSVGGWSVTPILRRRGADEPHSNRTGAVQRIHRPDGTDLQVEFYGPVDTPPIIMTHGWGLDSDEWYYAKKQLARNYRLIVWDLPGLGKSSSPPNRDWSLEKLAGDLKAVLTLANGRPAILLGHSIGGMITLTFCRLFPEEMGRSVCGLVLAQSTYTNPVKTMSKASLYTALQKPLLEPLCHMMVWFAPLVWVMNWLSYLNGSAHKSTERSSFSGGETRGQLGFMTRYYVVAWPAVIARGMLAMFRYDASETLHTITVPTLVVTGDNDSTCTPEASIFMANNIPGARLVTLPASRHCGLFEHNQEFSAAVGEFAAACAAAVEPAQV